MKTYLMYSVLTGVLAASPAMAQDEFKAMGEAVGKQITEVEMAKVEGGAVTVSVNPTVQANVNASPAIGTAIAVSVLNKQSSNAAYAFAANYTHQGNVIVH